MLFYIYAPVLSLCTSNITRTLHLTRELQRTINLSPFAKCMHRILFTGHALCFSLCAAVFFPNCWTWPWTTISFLFACSFYFYFLRCLNVSISCFHCFLNKFLERIFLCIELAGYLHFKIRFQTDAMQGPRDLKTDRQLRWLSLNGVLKLSVFCHIRDTIIWVSWRSKKKKQGYSKNKVVLLSTLHI